MIIAIAAQYFASNLAYKSIETIYFLDIVPSTLLCIYEYIKGEYLRYKKLFRAITYYAV